MRSGENTQILRKAIPVASTVPAIGRNTVRVWDAERAAGS